MGFHVHDCSEYSFSIRFQNCSDNLVLDFSFYFQTAFLWLQLLSLSNLAITFVVFQILDDKYIVIPTSPNVKTVCSNLMILDIRSLSSFFFLYLCFYLLYFLFQFIVYFCRNLLKHFSFLRCYLQSQHNCVTDVDFASVSTIF